MLTHTCNPNSWEMKQEDLTLVQSHSGQHTQFEAILGYMKPVFKKKKTNHVIEVFEQEKKSHPKYRVTQEWISHA